MNESQRVESKSLTINVPEWEEVSEGVWVCKTCGKPNVDERTGRALHGGDVEGGCPCEKCGEVHYVEDPCGEVSPEFLLETTWAMLERALDENGWDRWRKSPKRERMLSYHARKIADLADECAELKQEIAERRA